MTVSYFTTRLTRKVAVPTMVLSILFPLDLGLGQSENDNTDLSVENTAKIEERKRYAEKTKNLRRQGKLKEAIRACEEMLALERDIFGNLHADVAGSLRQLGASTDVRVLLVYAGWQRDPEGSGEIRHVTTESVSVYPRGDFAERDYGARDRVYRSLEIGPHAREGGSEQGV